jgi:hypothetical protein
VSSRLSHTPACDPVAVVPSHPPGAVFFVDNTHLVRLVGHDEQTKKPWCAGVDNDGSLGSVQPWSLASLPPRMPPADVPDFVSIAVAIYSKRLFHTSSIVYFEEKKEGRILVSTSPAGTRRF